MQNLILVVGLALASAQSPVAARECWALTELKGQSAYSTDNYSFSPDGFSNPMVLCFDGEKGSVSGDDTTFTRFGTSTLAGWAQNKAAELFEVFQIDRANGKVLFTKIRVGSTSIAPGVPDLVAAYVGKATRIKD